MGGWGEASPQAAAVAVWVSRGSAQRLWYATGWKEVGGLKGGQGGTWEAGGECLTVDTGQDMQTCRGWEPRCEMGGLGGETQGRDVHVSGWVVGHRG